VTVAEFATELGMSVQTVRGQIANGRIESYQPGTSWPLLIPRTEIDRYRLASRRGLKPTVEPTAD
jgi:excisionase family DNA binding protein